MSSAPALTPQQRRTAKARAAFAARFPDSESRTAYFRALAARSAEHRRGGLVLSADDLHLLASALDALQLFGARIGFAGLSERETRA